MKDADKVRDKIEAIVARLHSQRSLDAETADWVGHLSPVLGDKLSNAGLIPKREEADGVTLKAFIDEYLANRVDIKGSTRTKIQTTVVRVLARFGANRSLASITEGDAAEWQQSLVAEKLAENTVRMHMAVAKLLFNHAVRKRILTVNPFKDQASSSRLNPTRYHFITEADAVKVLAACPDVEWRLIFALARWGGLRCPSEHMALTWGDIDWENNRLTVRASKTEHHVGSGIRIVPLFAELKPHLEAAIDAAEPGAQFVITTYRDTNQNLRTQRLSEKGSGVFFMPPDIAQKRPNRDCAP